MEVDMITAVAHDDGYIFEILFDATPYFKGAAPDEIRKLAECGWGGDYPADFVAYHMESLNADLSQMLAYCQRRKKGFECYVDRNEALDWLRDHRPDVFALIEKAEAETLTKHCPVYERHLSFGQSLFSKYRMERKSPDASKINV
jgi:hypothetical protein